MFSISRYSIQNAEKMMDLTPRPQEGDQLPAWTLRSLNGKKPPSLEEVQGSYVLLLFYNLGCTGCVGRGLPLAQRIQDLYPDLRVILIHSDFGQYAYPEKDILAEAQRQQLQLEQYRDQGHMTYDAYGAEGTPHWVLIDPQGRLYRSFFGSMQQAQLRMDYVLRELFGD